jgi:hypothetical protein
VDDYLRDLQETINCFPSSIIRINQIPISSICSKLLLNSYVDDDRPIPLNSSGIQISVFFMKWYLDRKIKEWIALGGVRDWFDGLEVCERGRGPRHSYYLYLGLSTSSKEDLFAKTSFDRMSRYDAQPIPTLVLSTHWYMSHFAY